MKSNTFYLFGLVFILFVCACEKDTSQFDKIIIEPKNSKISTIHVLPGSNLKTIIESAGSNTRVLLYPGDFYVSSSINITKKKNFSIVGYGNSQTKIYISPYVDICFKIKDSVTNLTIEDVLMQVAGNMQTNTHAIGSNGGVKGVNGVLIQDNYINNVAVGISVGGGYYGDYQNVIVKNNIIENATYSNNLSGQGYGIHSDNTKNLIVESNYINKAGRHSIYVGRGDGITISRNLILNNDWNNTQNDNIVALAIARSRNVKVVDNLIFNSYATAISAEYDDVYSEPTDEIYFINNRVVGGRANCFFINQTTGCVFMFSNFFIPHPGTNGSLITPGYSYQICNFLSNYPIQGLTRIGGYYYFVSNNYLHKCVFSNNFISIIQTSPINWFNFSGITGLSYVTIGDKIFIVQNSVLHRINTSTLLYESLSSAIWSGPISLSAANGKLIIIQNNSMHRVDPLSLNYDYISPTNWSNTQAMEAWGDYVYILRNGLYYRVDPIDLSSVVVGY
jgi:hypothetical protein